MCCPRHYCISPILKILSYYAQACITTSRIAYWTSLCQLVDSWPVTVSYVYAAGSCHNSINWVTSFPQAPESEILSCDILKTVAGSICVKCTWCMHVMLVCHNVVCVWVNEIRNGFSIRAGYRIGQHHTCMSHDTKLNFTETCHITTSPYSQTLAWFLLSVTTVVIVFQCCY